jgi:hypothetical protein
MPRKGVKKEKTSKRGKGDIKQSVKVSVRIGDTKPKRKRAYKRKPKVGGQEGLVQQGESRTLYGSLPPQVITIQQQPQIPPQFQQQKLPSITSGDVEKAKMNLLEGLEKQTQEIVNKAIAKSQGAEQRSELARIGWVEPVAKAPTIMESVETTAPNFEQVKTGQTEYAKPLITEISSGNISKPMIQEEVATDVEPEPEEIQRTMSEQEKRNIRARERRSEESRSKVYDEVLAQYGFPAIRGNLSEEEFAKQIISIFEAVNSGGKKRVSKSNIQDYYGRRFTTLQNLASKKSNIPVKNIEELPLSTQKAEEYNLVSSGKTTKSSTPIITKYMRLI